MHIVFRHLDDLDKMCIVLEMLKVVLTQQNLPADLLNEQVKWIIIDLIKIFNSILKIFECSLRCDLHFMPFLGLLGAKMEQQDGAICNYHV